MAAHFKHLDNVLLMSTHNVLWITDRNYLSIIINTVSVVLILVTFSVNAQVNLSIIVLEQVCARFEKEKQTLEENGL